MESHLTAAMESQLFLHHRKPPAAGLGRSLVIGIRKRPSRAIVAVVANPNKNSPRPAASATEMMTVYKDTWFDRLAIHHISQSVQAITGVKNKKEGYEGFIEAAAAVAKNKDPNKQQDVVIQALHKAFPKPVLSLIRTFIRPTKFTREFFAVFTTVFFSWLIGPCEVRESELEGRVEKNVVYIKKCSLIKPLDGTRKEFVMKTTGWIIGLSRQKFLEGTSCAGMCINLCKMPSQRFIEDSFGIPVNMVPNFDDMSCEMIFGQEPPPANQDPALKQPCYKILCKAKQRHSIDCSS